MLKKSQLAQLLRQFSAQEVHEASADEPARRVSTKTIYRLRHEQTNPTLGMVERLEAACRVLKAKRRGPARMKAKA